MLTKHYMCYYINSLFCCEMSYNSPSRNKRKEKKKRRQKRKKKRRKEKKRPISSNLVGIHWVKGQSDSQQQIAVTSMTLWLKEMILFLSPGFILKTFSILVLFYYISIYYSVSWKILKLWDWGWPSDSKVTTPDFRDFNENT